MSRLRVVLTLCVAALLVTVPTAAFGRVSEYQVQYTPRGSGGVSQLIVNVVLSPETPLPAIVSVPLPAGAQVVWSGEILGGDGAADPYREATVTAVAGGQLATFTLEQVRVAQVEADLSAPTLSGNAVSSLLNWVNSGEEGSYTFSVVLEGGATNVTIAPNPPGEPARNDATGETLYTLEPVRLATGQIFALSVEYAVGAPDDEGGDPLLSVALVVLGVLLVAAIVALILVLRGQRARAVSAGPLAPTPERQTDRMRRGATGRPDWVPPEPPSPPADDDFFTLD